MKAFEAMDIDDAFEDYMRKVLPNCKETDIQFRESRRVWHAAMRRLLNYMRDELTKLPDDDGVTELQKLWDQGDEYWKLATEDKD